MKRNYENPAITIAEVLTTNQLLAGSPGPSYAPASRNNYTGGSGIDNF